MKKITFLLLAFLMFVGNAYSQTDQDPDKLGGPVIVGKVARFTLPVGNSAKQQKSSAKLAKMTSINSQVATGTSLEWPNPGAVHIEKTAEATATPGKWKIDILTQGKNIPTTTDVVLVIDDSGSMDGDKIASAKSAANTFVDELLTGSTGIRVSVVTINSPDSGKVSGSGKPEIDQDFTDNITSLHSAINSISAKGGTNLQGGFYVARLLAESSTADKQVVILLSDGAPTYSYESEITTDFNVDCGNISHFNISRNDFEAKYITVTSSDYTKIVGNGNGFDETLYSLTKNCSGNGNNDKTFEAGNHGIPTKYEAGLLMNDGVDIYTIGFEVRAGRDEEDVLEGSQNKGYYSATTGDITNIYSQIRSNIAYAATNAVFTDPMSTYIVLEAGLVPSFSVLPTTTGDVVVSKGTVTFSNNGYVLNDPDNTESGNSSKVKWEITWNIGTITEIGDHMYYYVTMAPNTDPVILYDANEQTYMDYTDVNGNTEARQETPTHFTIPKVSGGKGSIEIIYYAVNESGQPVNSVGAVVPKENAVKLIPGSSKYFEFNGSTALEINQAYTVSPESLYTSNSISYQLLCTFGDVSVTPTPTEPNKEVWFGYVVSTPPTTTTPFDICAGNAVTLDQLNASLSNDTLGGTWTDSLDNAITEKSESGTYTYTIGGGVCDDTVVTVTVTEQALPNAGIDGTLTVCFGTEITDAMLFAKLTGSPDETGEWTNDGLVYTYTVAATSPCTVADTSTVTEQALPNAGIDGALTVCFGTEITDAMLFAQLTGSPDETGEWTNDGLVYTYTVAATSPCTVADTSTVTVTEQALPNAGIDGTLTVCFGTEITDAMLFAQLTGSPDETGEWTNDGLVYTYTVAATSPCTESDSSTVTVTEQALPNAGIDGALTVCFGTEITDAMLFAQLTGSPDETGEWTNDGLVYTYTVAATSPCTVADTSTVTVTEQALPNAGIDGTLTVCFGTEITDAMLFAQLTGSPDETGEWTNDGLVYTYTVAATSPCTVDDTSTVTVTVQALPEAGTDGLLTVCFGTEITDAMLFAQLTGSPDETGEWTNDGLVYTYTVAATSPCTVADTSTVTVTEQALPNAGIDGTLTVCFGTEITDAMLFAQLTGSPDETGEWTNDGLVYTYTVAATSPCTVDDTSTVTVTVQALPEAGTDGLLTVCFGTEITDAMLFAQLTGSPDETGEWTNDGLVYTYTVAATSPCTESDTSTVTVTEQALPNAGIDGTLTVCFGTEITDAMLFAQLTDSPDETGEWTNDGLVYTYTVAATSPCTVADTSTVTVTEQALPNAGIDGTLTVCFGTEITDAMLFAQLTGSPDETGEWTNDGLVYTYTVAATSPCTVADTSTVTVTVQALPEAGTDGLLTVCFGTEITDAMLFAQLTGSPDETGEWTNDGLVYTYTVAATSPCTVADSSTVTVTEQALPNAGIDGTLTVCFGTEITDAMLFAQLTDSPDETGEWTNDGLVYTYTVAATSPCTESDTSTVTVNVTQINS
jgi:Mg-chelatase subunit ChlD